MYDVIKSCYDAGCYTKSDLNIFVTVGWITQAQVEEITGTSTENQPATD